MALAWLGWIAPAPALRINDAGQTFVAETVGSDLVAPAGLAVDPITGRLFVAEKGANRISLLNERARVTVLDQGFTIVSPMPAWALSSTATTARLREPVLRTPEDLDFDRQGRLYVAEGGVHGRLLRFEPFIQGALVASILFTPWSGMPYSYGSVAADNLDRIFVTARKTPGATLVFGSVMMCDARGCWFVAGYGPFADFSNVAVDATRSALVVGERRRGDLHWFDPERQAELAALEHLDGLRHVEFWMDGRTLATICREDGTWSLLLVEPLAGTVSELVGGLGPVGGIAVHPYSGEIYITQSEAGTVLRLRPAGEAVEEVTGDDYVTQLNRAFEIKHSLPPREWPSFFKSYIDSLDIVDPVDPMPGGGTPGTVPPATQPETAADATEDSLLEDALTHDPPRRIPMTLEELVSLVPIAAAKFKAEPMGTNAPAGDPIAEVSFLIFHPNQAQLLQKATVPSVSLFRATHRSGSEAYTKFMPNKDGHILRDDTPAAELPEMLFSFPTGYYMPESSAGEEGMVRVYFLGMGLGPDYWLDIDRTGRAQSRMMVENDDGTKHYYRLQPYPEKRRAGGESVLIAGLEMFSGGWLQVAAQPVLWTFVNSDATEGIIRHWTATMTLDPGNILTAPTVGPAYDGSLAQSEINLCRKLVLRAAARWKDLRL